MTNKNHTVLYTGVTSELYSRILDHKERTYQNSFTFRYNVTKLVYYENHTTIEEAIEREKQIKKGSRSKKEALINAMNPEWKELFGEIIEG